MQIPILRGLYVDRFGDLRASMPRNRVPCVIESGISNGYLRLQDGIDQFAEGPGMDRGGFNWEGVCYRVMGDRLVSVSSTGALTDHGSVGSGGRVTMDNGFGRLAIASGGGLYYWTGGTLSQVADSDLGNVIDMCWMAGYFVFTDGTFIGVTELNDPMAVNPIKYGSAEADPDPIYGVAELRNELYAFGRYTIEVFDNIGGENFPFQRIDGAQVVRGVIGTHAFCPFAQTFAFLGGGKNEALSVYLVGPGSAEEIATPEIIRLLATYTDDQLKAVVLESKLALGRNLLYVHLPDQTLVFDIAASKSVGEQVWYTLDSGIGEKAKYRALGMVWCYGKWIVGDTNSPSLGVLTESHAEHFGEKTGWDFNTIALYNEGNGAIVSELELTATPGRVAFGAQPTIWTSYSLDGQTFSQEKPIEAGKAGERLKRLCWRRQGKMRNYRIQRFRGTSDAFVSFARLEAQLEGLNG